MAITNMKELRRKIRNRLRKNPEIILSPVALIVFLAVWELIVRIYDIPRIILPSPSAIGRSFFISFAEQKILRHIWVTLFETLVGFAIGSTSGFILGAVVAQFKLVERTFYPYIVAFQALPKVAIAPLIIIWTGYGIESKIIMSALITFFPLLVNTLAGLNSTDQDYIEMLRGFSASELQILRKVKFPMALPYIFAGIDMAAILSLIGALVGEFVGAKEGLGYLLLFRQFKMDIPSVFAILIILSLIGVGFHTIIFRIQKKVVFWVEPEIERIIGS